MLFTINLSKLDGLFNNKIICGIQYCALKHKYPDPIIFFLFFPCLYAFFR